MTLLLRIREGFYRLRIRSIRGAPASRGELFTVAIVVVLSIAGNIAIVIYGSKSITASVVVAVALSLVAILSAVLLIFAYFDRASKRAAAYATLLNIKEFARYAPVLDDDYDPVYLQDIQNMVDEARLHVANMVASGDRRIGQEISESLSNLMVSLGANGAEPDVGAKELDR